ncbi:MAG: M20/M25/M40 family metallo-hydrolase [Candidatus Aminicenantes bacterium]|nr:M20/M25/M40 family metallo-hydrolase [Candidatus Aminicenantes bacterium]
MDPIGLLKDLVGIPSTTGSEGALADHLAGLFDQLPFRVLRQPVEPGRDNLFITAGEDDPKVVLCTHMDTVPGAAAATEDEKSIYGRGACDAKGSLAAMAAAAFGLADRGVSGFGLLFVVGEETDSIGARTANGLGLGSGALIVGEPTGNKLGLGHKGALFVELHVAGRRAHSALPHLGASAIEALLDILNSLRAADFGRDPVLGPTLLNIGRIEGGVAPNVIADEATSVLGLRPAVSCSETLARLAEAVAGRARIEIITASEPQKLWTLPGFETDLFPFGTDCPHLTAFGRPFLVGPGDARWAHAEDERIAKSEILAAVPIYESLVTRLLEGEEPTAPRLGRL